MTVTQLLPISARKREAEKAKRRDPKASAEILRAFFFFLNWFGCFIFIVLLIHYSKILKAVFKGT